MSFTVEYGRPTDPEPSHVGVRLMVGVATEDDQPYVYIALLQNSLEGEPMGALYYLLDDAEIKRFIVGLQTAHALMAAGAVSNE